MLLLRRIPVFSDATVKKYEGSMQPMLSYISGITNIPWDEVTFLGHGHTIPFQGITGYSAVWLLNAELLETIGYHFTLYRFPQHTLFGTNMPYPGNVGYSVAPY